MSYFSKVGMCWLIVGVCAVVSLTSHANAGTVTGPPVTGFTTLDASKDITLLDGNSSFTGSLSGGDAYADWVAEIHSLLGDNGTPGQSDFEHQQDDGPDVTHGDISLPYAMVGRAANGENGTFVYKFVTESGFETSAGGTIAADMYFRHEPDGLHGDNAWIGVGTSLSVAANLGGINNDTDFIRVTMNDLFTGGFATYTGAANLSVPTGVNEFYVVVSDFYSAGVGQTHSSARLAITSFQVDVNLTPGGGGSFPLGDFDMDGNVTTLDWDIMKSFWLTTGQTFKENGEVTGDGIVDLADFKLFKETLFVGPASAFSSAVPEPSTFAILLAMAPAWLVSRLRIRAQRKDLQTSGFITVGPTQHSHDRI